MKILLKKATLINDKSVFHNKKVDILIDDGLLSKIDNNIDDIISLAIIAISILLGFSRGLIRECYTILAWVLSFFSTIQPSIGDI